MPLDLSKLQNVRASSNGSKTAMCPCCKIDHNRDASGNHLVIYADSRFGCAAFPNDPAHRSRIWALAGDGSPGIGAAASTEETTHHAQISVPTIYPANALDRLIRDYSYWEGRGISAETVAPFRGGIATQFEMKDRWVFPQYNDNDDIIGFSGRCLRKMTREERKHWKRPAWKHLSPKPLGSSHFVWGGLDEIEESGRVLLVEGIGDGLSAREHGIPENLCLFGTNISSAVLGKLIALNPREIIICTNNDAGHHTGRNVGAFAAAKVEKLLLSFFDRHQVRVLLPLAKDLGEMSRDQMVEWKNILDSTQNPRIVEVDGDIFDTRVQL